MLKAVEIGPERSTAREVAFYFVDWDNRQRQMIVDAVCINPNHANSRVTVKHNGVLVYEKVEIPGITRVVPIEEENSPGPLSLQDHRSLVRYRNIRFAPK